MRAGVTRMIAVGVDLGRSRRSVQLARDHDPVWAAIGHYPLEESELDLVALRELAADPRVVAVGEIGLDYEHPGGVAREVQVDRLDGLLALATELDLPVSVHNRGADADVLAAIHRHPGLRGVMHYFALEWEQAQRFLELGFYLSFAGLVTRPSRAALREVVRQCPSDRLLLETDSPYGNAHKRMGVPNRPAYMLDTAELVAELRSISLEQLGRQETANALALFRRMN
ncbi:MAG TPA: TatD family hydrolase [Candidatus Dormibacteraeota bacterium]